MAGRIPRPGDGPAPAIKCLFEQLPLSGGRAWRSNGGPDGGHPARAYPSAFESAIPSGNGRAARATIVGVLAIWATADDEPPGTIGAVIEIVVGEEVERIQLVNGRHYGDPTANMAGERAFGDGTSVRQVGACILDGSEYRLDALSIDLPALEPPSRLRFRDLGTPASFVVLDVFYEFEPRRGCPFHSSRGGVSLAEVPAIIRVGDRVRLQSALSQLEAAIAATPELDEARGEALTFIAVVTAATLEMGGGREMHRVQLDSAREMDRLESREAIARYARNRVSAIAQSLLGQAKTPMDQLVDRALQIVDRNYAKNLTDSVVAEQLGLSTSHFRFLFRKATGHPFHRYLIALRLERAKRLLVDEGLAVSDVASAVGFSGLSHFSRAFAQRFKVSPSSMRRAP